jgi:hypothetical protein
MPVQVVEDEAVGMEVLLVDELRDARAGWEPQSSKTTMPPGESRGQTHSRTSFADR